MTRRGNWMLGKRPSYQGALTQEDADAILAEFVLPPGWRLIAAPIRSFESRSEWALALFHGDVLERRPAVYDLRGAAFHLQAHAEREARAVTVTTDRDGWVTSIEETDHDDEPEFNVEGQPEFNGSFR